MLGLRRRPTHRLKKPRLRGSGAAGAPGFGSGRRQGTVGPGPARGQESGLKLQLCRSLTGRCPGRWGRCSAIAAGWTLGPRGPGSSWLRLAPQRPAADREVPTPMEQGQWGSRQAGQLGTCSWAWRLGSGRGLFRSGAPERGLGRTRRPMGMYTKAVWKAGRSGPALGEGREWPAEEQRRAAHQTGGQAAAWRGQGTEGRARPLPSSGPGPCPQRALGAPRGRCPSSFPRSLRRWRPGPAQVTEAVPTPGTRRVLGEPRPSLVCRPHVAPGLPWPGQGPLGICWRPGCHRAGLCQCWEDRPQRARQTHWGRHHGERKPGR